MVDLWVLRRAYGVLSVAPPPSCFPSDDRCNPVHGTFPLAQQLQLEVPDWGRGAFSSRLLKVQSCQVVASQVINQIARTEPNCPVYSIH